MSLNHIALPNKMFDLSYFFPLVVGKTLKNGGVKYMHLFVLALFSMICVAALDQKTDNKNIKTI